MKATHDHKQDESDSGFRNVRPYYDRFPTAAGPRGPKRVRTINKSSLHNEFGKRKGSTWMQGSAGAFDFLWDVGGAGGPNERFCSFAHARKFGTRVLRHAFCTT